MVTKVFDWLIRFGIMAAVVLCYAGISPCQDKPGGKKGDKSKVVTNSSDSEDDEEDAGVIEIIVRIPKPEAMIFSSRMKSKYRELGHEKSFVNKIVESAKHSPF